MNAVLVSLLLVWVLTCGARPILDKGHHLEQPQGYDEDEGVRHSARQEERYHAHHRGEEKKSTVRAQNEDDDSVRSNELNDGYDEYPIVTPKRAAMLLDRIMVALHHALEDSEEGQGRKINGVYRDGHYYGESNGYGQATSKTHPKSTKEKTFGHGAASGAMSKIAYSPHKVRQMIDDEAIETGSENFPAVFDERSVNTEQGDENLVSRDNTMDLQRRGHDASTGSGVGATGAGKGRVYWRCYFNAVTCF